MSDISFDGVFAAFIFLALIGIGVVVLVIALIFTIIQKSRNSKSLSHQPAFGFVISAFICMVVGLLSLYSVASIHNDALLTAFDNYISFIIMIVVFAIMLFVGRRWRRKHL